jgi:O-antigen ligase
MSDASRVMLLAVFLIMISDYTLSALDSRYPALQVVRFLPYLLSAILLAKSKIRSIELLWIAFILWMLVTGLLNQHMVLNEAFFIFKFVALAIIINYYAQRGLVRDAALIFFFASVVGMITNLVFDPRTLGVFLDVYESDSQNYGRTVWFTGTRNTFGEYFLLSTTMVILGGWGSRRWKVVSLLWSVVGVLLSVYVWSATSIATTVLILGIVLLGKFWRVPPVASLAMGIAFSLSIVMFRIQDVFSSIIVGVLRRDLTFTNRTVIWDFYLSRIPLHPISGGSSYANVIPALGVEFPAHNVVLSVVDTYGIVGVALVLAIFLRSAKDSAVIEAAGVRYVLSAIVFVFLVRGTFESQWGVLFVYMTMLANAKSFVRSPTLRHTEDLDANKAAIPLRRT